VLLAGSLDSLDQPRAIPQSHPAIYVRADGGPFVRDCKSLTRLKVPRSWEREIDTI
jgi:hypothetical protein